MKPHVLLLLLLAIPPLISNILASENAEKSDAAPALSSDSPAKPAPASHNRATSKDTPAPVAPAPVAPSVSTLPPVSLSAVSVASNAQPAASHSGGAAGLKAWFMLW